MSGEKTELNVFPVKPQPPSLLGSLTGDLNDSNIELRVPASIKRGADDMKLKDEGVYDDGSELNINIDEEPMSGTGEDGEVDLGDLASFDDQEVLELDAAPDAISPEIEKGAIDQEELSLEEGGGQGSVQKEESEKDSEEGFLGLEDLELKLDIDEDEDSEQ